jgi:Putative zinc-finger
MMQQGSCEEIQLLISRYVDDEVNDGERELVEAHVATCEACACVLLQWVEMAAIFAETPMREPEPELRARLFRELGNQKEDARRKAERVPAGPLAWRAPQDAPSFTAPVSFPRRLVRAASPLMAASLAVFFLLGTLLLSRPWSREPDIELTDIQVVVPPIPTSDAPLSGEAPPPVMTRIGGLPDLPPAASTITYMSATATLGPYTILDLIQPTPVLEDGAANSRTDWHVVRDPMHGYRISYPSNWWTRVLDNTRYFYPWTVGGTRYAPYWIELSAESNDAGLTADTGNEALCGGECALVKGAWLHRTSSDDRNAYHDGYLFDRDYIYHLSLIVPMSSIEGMGGFQERSAQGESVFSTMSGRLALAGDIARGDSAYSSVLFLRGSDPNRGSDLYSASLEGASATRLTWDGGVKSFALSPDLHRVAYAATMKDQSRETWAKYIYLATLGADGSAATPELLVSAMESIHDLAWYSDRELVFLAESMAGELGLYKLRVPVGGSNASTDVVSNIEPDLLVSLGYELRGARSLAVSPDRQLITFLAPLGGGETSDIYAVRPDGSDLRVILSSDLPVAPLKDGIPVLAPESQAIKSYVWLDGHLEANGYAANVLFTCGNSYSPSSVLGGALYSGPRKSLGPLIDPFDLVLYEPERLQITHLAYSRWGKVAFTGYYNDFEGRPDKFEGLWSADMSGGKLHNLKRLPGPQEFNGVTDLQWSPDGESLIYRETITAGNEKSARYNGEPSFRMIMLNLAMQQTTVLFDTGR